MQYCFGGGIVAGQQMNMNFIGIDIGEFRRCAIPEGRKPAHGDNGPQMANAPNGHIDGAGKRRTGIGCINGVDVFFARSAAPIPKTLIVIGASGKFIEMGEP